MHLCGKIKLILRIIEDNRMSDKEIRNNPMQENSPEIKPLKESAKSPTEAKPKKPSKATMRLLTEASTEDSSKK